MSKYMRFFLIYLLLLLPTYANAATITGKVIKVLDGDTIDILYNNKPERIRFNGIDAPEKGMPYGQKAKQFVLDLAAQKIVSVNVTDTDRYGRSIGDITLPDGKNLNREVVKAGYAWWYRQYSDDASLGALEAEAKAEGRGLWKDPSPTPPWEWRHGNRNQKSASVSDKAAAVSPYHGNVSSHVFHRDSCQYFNCSNCVKNFNSTEEAIEQGYRACKICRP